jgi:hypothetical protein
MLFGFSEPRIPHAPTIPEWLLPGQNLIHRGTERDIAHQYARPNAWLLTIDGGVSGTNRSCSTALRHETATGA